MVGTKRGLKDIIKTSRRAGESVGNPQGCPKDGVRVDNCMLVLVEVVIHAFPRVSLSPAVVLTRG